MSREKIIGGTKEVQNCNKDESKPLMDGKCKLNPTLKKVVRKVVL